MMVGTNETLAPAVARSALHSSPFFSVEVVPLATANRGTSCEEADSLSGARPFSAQEAANGYSPNK